MQALFNGALRNKERLGALYFVGIAPVPGLSTLGVCIQLGLWVGSDNVIMTVTVAVSLVPFGRLYSYVLGYVFRSFKVA